MKFASFQRLFGSTWSRRKAGRRPQATLALERLEDRTLLAVIPPIQVAGQVDISTRTDLGVMNPNENAGANGGHYNTPSIVIDPLDPSRLLSVYVLHDEAITGMQKSFIQGSYSADGGHTWTPFSVPGNFPDPTVTTNPPPLPQATDPSIAWDRSNHFYVLYSEHKADYSIGVIVLQKFGFNAFGQPSQATNVGGFVASLGSSTMLPMGIVYTWDAASTNPSTTASLGTQAALNPTMVVDTNVPTFQMQTLDRLVDPVKGTGPIYVSWNANLVDAGNNNHNFVQTLVSNDGGLSFGSTMQISSGGSDASPRLAVSQGTADGQIPGGQLTEVWDQYHDQTMNFPDSILSASMPAGGEGVSFSSVGGDYQDAIMGMNGDTSVTTPFTQNVDFSSVYGFGTLLTGFTVTVNIQDANVSDVELELHSPMGQMYTLLLNHINNMGGTINGQGVSGPNLGVIPATQTPFNCVFDSNALFAINDMMHVVSPYAGHFRPEAANLNTSLTTAQATGQWELDVIDHKNNGMNAVQKLYNWSLTFTSDLVPATLPNTVAINAARGNLLAGDGSSLTFPLAANVMPNPGIGPAVAIASDNTLGSFSPFQGRLYAAYVTAPPPPPAGYPADYVAICLVVSTDGGLTWAPVTTSGPVLGQVNDDNGTDGYSEGTRPKLEPSLAVDPTTGTLVISYYDARYDPARDRVVTTIATSIDGGVTFSKQLWANPSVSATDAVTGQTVNVQPVPDNESAGNSTRDSLFGFGNHQGLAVYQGHIYPIWAGNQNGWVFGNNGIAIYQNFPQLLHIYTANITIAAGPRIVASTMGQVVATRTSGFLFNNTFNAQGVPNLDGFTVTFDRYVDPATFTPAVVQVKYRNTDPSGAYVDVPVDDVMALDAGPFGAMNFFVHFQFAQNGTGTYSYVILPNVMDRIRWPDGSHTGNAMDQNANSILGEQPNNTTGGDSYAAPTPVNFGPNFLAPYDQTTLPLVIPGPHVSVTHVAGTPTSADNLVMNKSNNSLDVTFDRDMNAATVKSSSILAMIGPAGAINGPFTVVANPNGNDPDPTHPRTFRIGFPTQQLSGTYTLILAASIQAENGDQIDNNGNAGVDILFQKPSAGTTPVQYQNTTPVTILPGSPNNPSMVSSTININGASDNYVIQGFTLGNANIAGLNIDTHTLDPAGDTRDLAAYLVAPDGTQIGLFFKTGTTTAHQDFINTVLDDNAVNAFGGLNPIQGAPAPFTGAFNPQQPLSVLKGKLVTGLYRLVILNYGAHTDLLQNWSIVAQKAVSVSGLGEPVADQTMVHFRLFEDDPNNPISHSTYTAVGPASITSDLGNSESGRIGGLAVDPSDPSGNTVYVAGASGGIWKSSNFLTADPQGPTYTPLTDLGANYGVNIGGLAVFGRNNDPRQTIVFAGTGEGDTLQLRAAASPSSPYDTAYGIGLIRSMDGGATWTVLDSTDNTPGHTHDHKFVGNSTFKIVVDPKAAPGGGAIVYAAMSGPNGGLWKSFDSGMTWTLLQGVGTNNMATDVVLVPSSVDPNTGNLTLVYAAYQGAGVFSSSSGGSGLSLLSGMPGGNPLIQDGDFAPPQPIPVTNPPDTPNGAKGRIVLAVPAATGNRAEDLSYEGWIYAYVANTSGSTNGLYITKDFGENWTRIKFGITQVPALTGIIPVIPTNDDTKPDADILGGKATGDTKQGNYDISLTVDPTNPNIIYLGGTADVPPGATLIRLDITGLEDPHDVVGYNNFRNDGGKLERNTVGGVQVKKFYLPSPSPTDPNNYGYTLTSPSPYVNLFRDPFSPFQADTTLLLTNVGSFGNDGMRSAYAPWIPIDPTGGEDMVPVLINGGVSAAIVASTSTDQHRVISMIDPLTGHARLIFGDDQGVFTFVDKGDGKDTPLTGIGGTPIATGSRNGNLQITQLYGGAAQPSQGAANKGNGFFYGTAQDDGYPNSDNQILRDGNIAWTGPEGDAQDVHTAQTASPADGFADGTVFHYTWPCCNESTTNPLTDFVKVNYVGHVIGLLQQNNDPQWPLAQAGVANIAVNPVNPRSLVISSAAGRIFRTAEDGSYTWFPIGQPTQLDSTYAPALAFGAPDPADPSGRDDQIVYAGTTAGDIFVTFNGGGSWTKFDSKTGGLDGATVEQIVTNPHRGSHEAYAVTDTGVFYMADSKAPGAKWVNITGNVFQITHTIFGNGPNPTQEKLLKFLTSIVADWRFTILDNPANPNGPTHPVLYIGGDGGVFRSLDKGKTWTIFPQATTVNGIQVPDGGYLPVEQVTHLDLSVGDINPTTGLPNQSHSENILLVTTYGRGEFMIRLNPPNPLQETFVIGLDSQVYGQKQDSNGHPVGTYFLSTQGQVLDVRVGRMQNGLPEVFVKGLNDQIYAQKFDASGNSTGPYFFTATGQIKTFEVGSDALGDPEIFAIGLNDQVYTLKFNATGDPVGGYNFTTTGQVKSIQVGHDASNNPELFVLGLDNQVYYQKFNGSGDSASPYLFVDTGQVKSIKFAQTQNGQPELFVIGLDDQVYGHHFNNSGDSDHLGYFLAFFKPGNPQGTLYQVKSITTAHDGSNNPELFAIGLDNQVYAERYDASGNPDPTGYFTAALGQIKAIDVAFDANNDPELFAIGLDNQVYYATFDAFGRPTAPYNLMAQGQVLALRTTH
jgi:hypothetical protein